MKDRIELLIDETNEQWGIDAISIVHSPAIESNFVALNDTKGLTIALADPEKKVLFGAALIPNKDILRLDDQGNEFYIWFSEETVSKAAHLYMKRQNTHNTTLEHEHDVNDCYVIESWLKESDLDKSMKYGFRDLPIGTWFVKMKIDNDAVWDKIKKGEQKGFSIEGMFTQLASQNIPQEENKVEKIFNQLKQLINEKG